MNYASYDVSINNG